jgi:transcriptional regulator with XRE-family HTH domain
MSELGVTQDQLAQELGVTRGAVGHYLNGRREPSLEQMAIIARKLNMTVAELLGESVKTAAGSRAGMLQLRSVSRPHRFEPSEEWHAQFSGRPVEVPRKYEQAVLLTRDTLRIPRPDAWASMGPGAPLADHVDIVEHLIVHLTPLRRIASFSHPLNLRLLSAYGDSMEPTFKDGDLLLVDIGVTEIRIDAVYVLERDDELFVKRLQRRPDGTLLMISDNRNYAPYEIRDMEGERFSVRGRVVLAWNSRRL